MKATNKLFLIVFTCLVVLFGAGFIVYEMVAMEMSQKSAQSQNGARNSATSAQTSLLQKIFMDLDPPSDTSTSASGSNAVPANTGTSATLHFANEDEAMQYAMKKFSTVELISLMDELSHPDQLTPTQIQNLEAKVKSRFSHSEIVAMKEVFER